MKNSINSSFERALKTAPSRPGVYLFADSMAKVLYVGKAVNLFRRVQVYRRCGADGRGRMKLLLQDARTAEYRVTDNEQEAILLEQRLIQFHQPPLNVLLKDDKSFLFPVLGMEHRFPRLGFARKRQKKGKFFGPYPNAAAARRTKRLLQRAFGLRDCSDHTLSNRARACLKFGLGLCSAPCVNAIGVEEYAQAVGAAGDVLKGKVEKSLEEEKCRMQRASAEQKYEVALRARDRIHALSALAEPQKVRMESGQDFDVLGVDERGFFALLQYRDGEWLHSRHGSLPLPESPAIAVSQLLVALYAKGADLVPEILVGAVPEDRDSLAAWMGSRLQQKVQIFAPQRGPKRSLVRMAESNARAQNGASAAAPWSVVAQRIATIARCSVPSVVDCIDISHLQGKERVASKVRFVEGKPFRASYRRYLVGGGVGNDDFAAMREVVSRVLARAGEDGLADLLVLDGGRGQLSSGLQSLAESAWEMPIVALAKARRGRGPVAAEERLFVPQMETPFILERNSPERLFFEHIRDEAHRFAIGYHRRRRENVRWVLESVNGVGPKRRKVLLDFFQGNLSKIRDANLGEIADLPGLNAALALAIQEHLRRVLP